MDRPSAAELASGCGKCAVPAGTGSLLNPLTRASSWAKPESSRSRGTGFSRGRVKIGASIVQPITYDMAISQHLRLSLHAQTVSHARGFVADFTPLRLHGLEWEFLSSFAAHPEC
jgi:hypothetical protein